MAEAGTSRRNFTSYRLAWNVFFDASFSLFIGKDATEAFEDVGHSDEARDILKGLFIGNFDSDQVSYRPMVAAFSCFLPVSLFVNLPYIDH